VCTCIRTYRHEYRHAYKQKYISVKGAVVVRGCVQNRCAYVCVRIFVCKFVYCLQMVLDVCMYACVTGCGCVCTHTNAEIYSYIRIADVWSLAEKKETYIVYSNRCIRARAHTNTHTHTHIYNTHTHTHTHIYDDNLHTCGRRRRKRVIGRELDGRKSLADLLRRQVTKLHTDVHTVCKRVLKRAGRKGKKIKQHVKREEVRPEP
jgi:hypothetical protein